MIDKSSINILIAIVVVIAAATYISYNYIFGNNHLLQFIVIQKPQLSGEFNSENGIKPVAEKDKKYVCGDNKSNSNDFIIEFIIPFPCSQPVGLTVDKDNNIWVAANWIGRFLVFNPSTNTFVKNISIPNWNPETTFGSMMWDLKFDKNGDLWFTDEKSNSVWRYFVNEDRFERYKSPPPASYPLSLAFDSNGLVWYTNVFGKNLGILNPEEVKNNTTNGIREIDLGNRIHFETMGPSSMGFSPNDKNKSNSSAEGDVGSNPSNTAVNFADSKKNKDTTDTMLFSTVDFPYGGQIVKFNMKNQNFTVYDLNRTKSVPISISQDDWGMVWSNDHASSLFLMLNPQTGQVQQYSTSPASTRNTTTLPYYNQYSDGKIWFNEHEGNAIGYFDIKNRTLVEYHIPTRNSAWGNTSNPLKFTIDNNGSAWFTEWTENKLGVIPKEKTEQLPISLSASKDKMIIDSQSDKGDKINVSIYLHPNKQNSSTISWTNNRSLNQKIEYKSLLHGPINITMYVTSSIAKNGQLWNMTGKFDTDRFTLNGISSLNFNNPMSTTFEINPTKNVIPGNYTLTVSARYNNEITISKVLDLQIK